MKKLINLEYYFYVNDGAVLKNLNDMLECIRNINTETFSHHVTLEKNDFSNWTRDILKDLVLAKQLLKAKTRRKWLR